MFIWQSGSIAVYVAAEVYHHRTEHLGKLDRNWISKPVVFSLDHYVNLRRLKMVTETVSAGRLVLCNHAIRASYGLSVDLAHALIVQQREISFTNVIYLKL